MSPIWIFPVFCARLDGELNCFTKTPSGEFERITPNVVLGGEQATAGSILGRQGDRYLEMTNRFDLFNIVIIREGSDFLHKSMLGIQQMAIIHH